VHGFMGSPWEFLFLSHHLRHLGYEVRSWGHASVTRPTREYAEMLASEVKSELDSSSFVRVHMLGHSMGGIVVRGALAMLGSAVPPRARGRVVLMATPNHGSPVATALSATLGGLVPALSDMSEDGESYANSLPGESGWETGAIWTPYDHLVPPHSASPSWVAASVRVSGLHSGILLQPEVARMVGSFLSTGSFSPVR
jgi:pimeloyl-ACP methyl ester carboxylesterase